MCYFSNAFDRSQICIDTISHELRDPKFKNPDMIVGTGVSGILLLVPVSMKTGIPFSAIRKSLDIEKSYSDGGSHSRQHIETDSRSSPRKYVIIDDLIESGNTIRRIIAKMGELYVNCICTGIILYQDHRKQDYLVGNNLISLSALGQKIEHIAKLAELEMA